ELPLVVEDRAEEEVGLRDGLDLHRLLEELLRAEELPLARVDRAEGEVGEKRVLRDLNGPAQPALRPLEVLPLVQQHAVEDGGVEVVGLNLQGPFEVVLGAVDVSVVEEHLAQEEGELVVLAVELEAFLERLHAALGVERVEGRGGLADVLEESLALVALAEERDHAVAALVEALLLLQREHLLAHLRFPQLDELVRGDEVLLLQQLLHREEAGLVDEVGALRSE